jgi:hypothetical protein
MWALVGREGIEPPQSKTADLQSAELTTCSTYPRANAFVFGYPLDLVPWWRAHAITIQLFLVEPPMGLEPATGGLQNRCSTN